MNNKILTGLSLLIAASSSVASVIEEELTSTHMTGLMLFGGVILLVVGATTLMMQHRRTNKKLKQRTRLLENIISSMPEVVFHKDTQGLIKLCNEQACIFLDRTRKDVVGTNNADYFEETIA
ncbi:MAG: PAS domain-containing protein, partial [Oleibacter sp.]|nr:PAS domain-containing protein [Thalassolituus sp.]